MEEIGVLAIFCYNGDALAHRICAETDLDDVRKLVCEKWQKLTPLSMEFFYSEDNGVETVILSNSQLQSRATYCWAKKMYTTEIHIRIKDFSIADAASGTSVPGSSMSASVNTELGVFYKSNGWADIFKEIGQKFKDAVEFRDSLLRYSCDSGYKFKYLRNAPYRVSVECSKKEETGCKWSIHASKFLNMKSSFQIRKFVKEHTCGVGCRDLANPSFTSKLVANLIFEMIRDDPTVKPRDIMIRFRRDYGMPLPYYYAYHGKQVALKEIHGDEASSFTRLVPYQIALLEGNRDSIFELETDPDTNKFLRVFVAFGASIAGFRHCRPLIFLDATFLLGKYKGTLMAATAKNGNDGFYPIAFGICDSENEANWTWFLKHLKDIIPDGKIYTFVSDRHAGLLKSMDPVFGFCYHAHCHWHLKCNLRKAISSKDKRRTYICDTIFDKLGYASTHDEFQVHFQELLDTKCVQAIDFMKTVPVECWSNAYFQGRRYGNMSSSIAESFNSWIKLGCIFPVTVLVDYIRTKEMKKINEHREEAARWTSKLCPKWEKKVKVGMEYSRSMTLTRSDEFVFQVQSSKIYRVDLASSYCSCQMWRIEGFPCAHAMACMVSVGKDVYDYVEECFHATTFRSCYRHTIDPVLLDDVPLEVTNIPYIHPPDVRRQPGRPKKKRIENSGAKRQKREIKCSICKTRGHHNKKTCPSVLA